MGSTVIGLIVAVIIGIGIRSILRDWRKKFAADDRAAEAQHRAQIERNKAEVKRGSVTTLEKGEDGVTGPRTRPPVQWPLDLPSGHNYGRAAFQTKAPHPR